MDSRPTLSRGQAVRGNDKVGGGIGNTNKVYRYTSMQVYRIRKYGKKGGHGVTMGRHGGLPLHAGRDCYWLGFAGGFSKTTTGERPRATRPILRESRSNRTIWFMPSWKTTWFPGNTVTLDVPIFR